MKIHAFHKPISNAGINDIFFPHRLFHSYSMLI